MNKASYHILRVGLAITFLWVGVLILKNPESFGGLLLPWALNLLPVSLEQAMMSTAILDIVVGLLLLVDFAVWIGGLIASVHLVIVLATTGISIITVRDIGLLAGSLAVTFETFPWQIFRTKY